MSPHLTIYEPQLTWLMSIGHRITGAGLACLVYGGGIGYAAAHLSGVSAAGVITEQLALSSSSMAAAVFGVKMILSTSFFFHTYNGIRHLVWDMGYALSLKAVYAGGWLVNVGSIVSAAVVSIFL